MFEVTKERCDQCLFSKDKIVSDNRRKEVLNTCKRNDSHFVCHKASIAGKDICCKGFYETQSTNLIRVMGRLNGIQFVEIPDMPKDV